MTETEHRTLRTLCATWLPRDALVPVDAVDAGVDTALGVWLDQLPLPHRLRMRGVLRSVESGFGMSEGRPGARFSDALPDARRNFLETLGRGRLGPDLAALRAEAVRCWIGHPAVRSFLSIAHAEAP